MSTRRRDEGSVLPLVLVLMVVGSLIVLPLMSYTIAVFKSNTVVSNRTAQSEAAKGGLRMVLADPKNVFLTCDGGGNLTPGSNVINGISVQTTCSEISEVGPNEALGYEVPKGAVAMQLGASVPIDVSGGPASSGPAFPYPASPAWWASPATPDPLAQYSKTATNDLIWMPDLPLIPATTRTSTPFDMPAGFGCKVFFPGRYSNPVNLTGRIYFTSGVYYFDEPVTITADADVVVGYGLEDFIPASDCADDLQVATNVLNPPATFDITGGGATWVFGENGHLDIDNATMTSGAKVRFNQRYDTVDRGGRVSIMTVNGNDSIASDHVVNHVNLVPRSLMLNGAYEVPINGTGYVPSSSVYTDKARVPSQPDALVVDDLQFTGSAANRGAMVLTWDEVSGQAAGGALLGAQDATGAWTQLPYEVRYRASTSGTWIDACPATAQIVTPKPVAADGNTVSCVITGLTMNLNYDYRIRTVNEVGTSPWRSGTLEIQPGAPVVDRSAPADNVVVTAGVADDVAQISWDTPVATGGLPISGYDVVASLVSITPQANVAPVAPPGGNERLEAALPLPLSAPITTTTHIRAYDPNGDDLTLTINAGSLPAGVTVVANDVDDTIAATVAPLTLPGSYRVQYSVTDPDGLSANGELWLDVTLLASILPHAPVAEPVTLLADTGVPITTRLPVSDRDGLPLAAAPIAVDTAALGPEWTVAVNGIDVTITTTLIEGTYTIPYTVTDASGTTASSTIDVTLALDVQPAGTCSVTADPGVALVNACEISVPDVVAGTPLSGPQGYRFEVFAKNAAGVSDPATPSAPMLFGFDGGGTALPTAPDRIVEPWIPEAIIDIDASGSAPVELQIAGYVSVPMGRLHVENPNGFAIGITGGVMVGTFDVADARATGTADSVPIGFKNDIVLQRKVKIVSVAQNVTSTAIVEINEDGAGYAVNQWVVG